MRGTLDERTQMDALLCANAVTACLAPAGLPLPRRGAAPCTGALAVPVSLRRRRLPTRGLRCAGADWPEPSSLVGFADKTDAAATVARKARASAKASGEGKKTWIRDGVNGGTMEESGSVPFTPFEQSLVVVDSVIEEKLSQHLPAKLDFEEMSTYIIYGTGAFFAGWVLSAVVSAIDSIPLLPKVLEVVGLGYTIWFSTRYLLFKESRDELFVKVDDIKRRIVGSGEE